MKSKSQLLSELIKEYSISTSLIGIHTGRDMVACSNTSLEQLTRMGEFKLKELLRRTVVFNKAMIMSYQDCGPKWKGEFLKRGIILTSNYDDVLEGVERKMLAF